jgi:virginiamycin A acetyltransferase
MRFDEATVSALREIAWWDWPIETITENLPHIVGADLEALWVVHESLRDPTTTRGPYAPSGA